MSGTVERRLAEIGITLPDAASPVANYVPTRRSGNLLFVSGQLPMEAGRPKYTGTLGGDVAIETGQAAARLCVLNILAQLSDAVDGDLDRVRACVRLGVYVAATADFVDHPKIANGASDLMVEVFGDAGRHSRAAVGVASLPLGAPVEIEAVFEIG